MSDVHGVVDTANDGSLAGAVDGMPDIDQLEIANGDREGALRGEDGKFEAKEPANDDDAKPEEGEAKTEDKVVEAAEDETDDEDDYFEIPAEEEGAEPQRLKASEVFEGYQRAQTLEQELENVKATAPPPPDYDTAIMESVQRANDYLTRLNQAEVLIQPQQPNMNLINQAHPDYDPDDFFEQTQFAEQQARQHQAVLAERDRVQQEVAQQEEALTRARNAREMHKLHELWPEMKEEAFQNKVRDFASKTYGIDQETYESVHDSRFFALLKDAQAYREQSAAKETAVKVVKAKPKLVKGKARTSNPANRRSQEGMQRLQQSGSFEDAADALDGLI